MHKALAAAQQELAVDGPLTAFVDIDSQGQPTSVSVVESPSPEMSKAATSVLMRERYKPASCGGVACPMQFALTVTFTRR